jgi:hypothetical protein
MEKEFKEIDLKMWDSLENEFTIPLQFSYMDTSGHFGESRYHIEDYDTTQEGWEELQRHGMDEYFVEFAIEAIQEELGTSRIEWPYKNK